LFDVCLICLIRNYVLWFFFAAAVFSDLPFGSVWIRIIFPDSFYLVFHFLKPNSTHLNWFKSKTLANSLLYLLTFWYLYFIKMGLFLLDSSMWQGEPGNKLNTIKPPRIADLIVAYTQRCTMHFRLGFNQSRLAFVLFCLLVCELQWVLVDSVGIWYWIVSICVGHCCALFWISIKCRWFNL